MASVREFHDPVEYLTTVYAGIRKRNSMFSLRSWSRDLKLPHPAVLSMILNKRRKLNAQLAARISRALISNGTMTESDAHYFNLLVLRHNAKTESEQHFYEDLIAPLLPLNKFSTLSLDRFRAVADWHHFAILELTYLKNFNPDPKWISLRLGGNVNESQVNDAIERLVRLGLLERKSNGSLCKTNQTLIVGDNKPDTGLKRHHAQMMERAQEKLVVQPLEQREFLSHTTATSRAKIAEAKRRIERFRKELANLLDEPAGSCDVVYQCNIQFFKLIEDSNEDVHA